VILKILAADLQCGNIWMTRNVIIITPFFEMLGSEASKIIVVPCLAGLLLKFAMVSHSSTLS
jgi:hypothetical protein